MVRKVCETRNTNSIKAIWHRGTCGEQGWCGACRQSRRLAVHICVELLISQ